MMKNLIKSETATPPDHKRFGGVAVSDKIYISRLLFLEKPNFHADIVLRILK